MGYNTWSYVFSSLRLPADNLVIAEACLKKGLLVDPIADEPTLLAIISTFECNKDNANIFTYLEWLYQQGADVNAAYDGRRALYETESLAETHFFLEHDADPFLPNKLGQTAVEIHIAKAKSHRAHVERDPYATWREEKAVQEEQIAEAIVNSVKRRRALQDAKTLLRDLLPGQSADITFKPDGSITAHIVQP